MTRSFRQRALRLLPLPVSVLLAGVLAACGGSGDSGDPAGDSGTINWAYTSTLPGWDPVVLGATAATQVLSTIYEPLFTLDASNQIKPALATAWKYNDDGTAVTITLRPGLTFQDGSPLNAAAVAYNVERIQTQENSALKALWQDVKSATVIDDTHVRLDLKQVDYQIPYVLANRTSLLASEQAAKADPAALNTSRPIGAGPFRVTKLVPDSSVTLEKWDGYWDAANIHVDRITISLNVDPSTLLSGLQTGVYNFSTSFPAQDVALAKKQGLNVVSDVKRGWAAYFLSLNRNKAPFDNPKVFQAVQYAINRKALVDGLSFGLGSASVQPFAPTSPAYDPALGSGSYDPAKAKQLLAEAGYPPGALTVELDAITGQFNAAAELLQQQLQAVGVNAKINLQTVSQFFPGYYGKTDQIALYGYVGRDSKLSALDDQFGSGGILNLSAPSSSAGYAQARQKVLSTKVDDPHYASVLQAATRAGVEGGSNITLYTQPYIYVTGKDWSPFPVIDGSYRWNGLTVGAAG